MRNTLVLFLMILVSNLALGQVQFDAKVSKSKLGVNERLRVDFIMNEDGDNFSPPSFENFTVVGGPNQAVSNSWINGKRSYSKTYSYFLAPKARGKFTIGQAEISIDDNIYKTMPVQVEVTAAVDEPQDADNSDYIASENIHLVAEISNTNPYLNEAITVVYKLYVSPRINVSDWRQLDSPKFSDFWSQNIDIRRLEVENGTYQGEPYRFVVLRKTVLYPQKTGKLNIEPLTLNISVEVPGNRRDIFGNRFYETVDKVVAAGNRTIEVKALPEDGKPAGFTGAVGKNLGLQVTADKTELRATESLQLTVEVTGQGNLKLFDLPPLTVPASMEQYEPEYVEKVNTSLSGMQGSIFNTYTLVPQTRGKYPIPPVNFSYFDLDSQSYRTLTSEEIMIEAGSPPAGAKSPSGSTGPIATQQQTPSAANQFKYIKLNTALKPIGEAPFLGSPLFWSLLLGPVLLIPLAILFGKRREAIAGDVRGNRIKKANRLARKYLSEAKRNLGDQTKFYDSLERALHNYLKAKLHIQTSEMSKERIQELLATRGVDAAAVTDFNELLKNCEFARYTPTSRVAMQQDYDKAVGVISAIDKQV